MSDDKGTDLDRAIASAWRRHAQRVHYQWPMGCGGHAALQTPEVMAEMGFRQAVHEVATLFDLAETAPALYRMRQSPNDLS